ncbi:hypothetical protein MNBD_ALPHA12-674, partial [hydrothermal vent metagenome]
MSSLPRILAALFATMLVLVYMNAPAFAQTDPGAINTAITSTLQSIGDNAASAAIA